MTHGIVLSPPRLEQWSGKQPVAPLSKRENDVHAFLALWETRGIWSDRYRTSAIIIGGPSRSTWAGEGGSWAPWPRKLAVKPGHMRSYGLMRTPEPRWLSAIWHGKGSSPAVAKILLVDDFQGLLLCRTRVGLYSNRAEILKLFQHPSKNGLWFLCKCINGKSFRDIMVLKLN